MGRVSSRALLSFLLSFSSLLVRAEVLSGTVSTTTASSFVFIGKFGYSAPPNPTVMSTFQYNITANAVKSGQYLLLYDDQASSWPTAMDVLNTNQSCLDATFYARSVSGTSKILLYDNINNVGTINVNEHDVPRYWYVVVANCYGTVDIAYSFTFLQYSGSQFSEEREGVLGFNVFFFILYFIGTAIRLYYDITIKFKHHILTAYTTALCLQVIALLLYVMDYGVYSSNGVGVPFFRGTGSWIEEASVVILFGLLMLTAMGYTENIWPERKAVLVVGLVYIILETVLKSWYLTVVSTSWETSWFFDSALGVLLLIARIFIGGLIMFFVRTTRLMESHPEKKKFYTYVAVISAVWLILGSIVILIFDALPWYWQTRVQMGMLLFFNSLAFVVCGHLYRHSFVEAAFSAGALKEGFIGLDNDDDAEAGASSQHDGGGGGGAGDSEGYAAQAYTPVQVDQVLVSASHEQPPAPPAELPTEVVAEETTVADSSDEPHERSETNDEEETPSST